MSLEGIERSRALWEQGHVGLAPRAFVVPVRMVRVWQRPDDLAGRVAMWARFAAWLLTWGRAGAVPWTWRAMTEDEKREVALELFRQGFNLSSPPPGPLPPAPFGARSGAVRPPPPPGTRLERHGRAAGPLGARPVPPPPPPPWRDTGETIR